MRQYPRRIEPLHEDGACGELDVMVVREISFKHSRLVRLALDNLVEHTGGLVQPISLGEIPFPLFGGALLKRAVLDKKPSSPRHPKNSKKAMDLSQGKMQDVLEWILDRYEFPDLNLELDEPVAPFYVDEYDRLVVRLDDSNEELARDRENILNAVVDVLDTVEQEEIDSVTYFKPPAIVVGEVQRHMLGFGKEHADFTEDPNAYLANLIDDSVNTVDSDGLRIPTSIFPSSVCFGALNIVRRKRVPAVKQKLEVVETPLPGYYDGLRLIKPRFDEEESLDEAI